MNSFHVVTVTFSVPNVTYPTKSRWPSAFWRNSEPEPDSDPCPPSSGTVEVSDEGVSVQHGYKVSSWWNRSPLLSSAPPVVDQTKLSVFHRSTTSLETSTSFTDPAPLDQGGDLLQAPRTGILSPLTPSSVCPSTRVVLSRGIIEYPDVELRDTSSEIGYPEYPTNCSVSPLTFLCSSTEPESVSETSAEHSSRIYTIMGRMRTGVGESKSFVSRAG